MNSIEPAELAALGATAAIVDVRQPDEYAAAHVSGAQLIPLGELPARLDELPADRTLYVICHSGGRSAQATAFLEAQGIDAVNVIGGILGWHGAGLPIEQGAE
ncbi:rhodanese-like domain-containing protein [Protaetiibacter mangrovi]|uniref:Rhodanese-like domain-containing protein n=1 Tax=Protaetiibacter mangrovi TaxID=2970926 RepID=A0ABT1ZEE9_9MICO|nr:rhodanese-like domain-containing protein [Protaetiibacter mangrovi]MCS0499086.1 rhodanese-like domain-containing protein [Protaetiibacter mangrovi]TPX05589.1 rhodanese-like domain-containing protein [Schumannella luteola]